MGRRGVDKERPEKRRAEVAFGYPKASAQGCPSCGMDEMEEAPAGLKMSGEGDKDWTISQV